MAPLHMTTRPAWQALRAACGLAALGLAASAAAQPLTPGYRRATVPPPKMACIVRPSSAFAGTLCPTKSGVRGSACQCGDLPYPGQRDFVRF